jgi:hypothetical protein
MMPSGHAFPGRHKVQPDDLFPANSPLGQGIGAKEPLLHDEPAGHGFTTGSFCAEDASGHQLPPGHVLHCSPAGSVHVSLRSMLQPVLLLLVCFTVTLVPICVIANECLHMHCVDAEHCPELEELLLKYTLLLL